MLACVSLVLKQAASSLVMWLEGLFFPSSVRIDIEHAVVVHRTSFSIFKKSSLFFKSCKILTVIASAEKVHFKRPWYKHIKEDFKTFEVCFILTKKEMFLKVVESMIDILSVLLDISKILIA